MTKKAQSTVMKCYDYDVCRCNLSLLQASPRRSGTCYVVFYIAILQTVSAADGTDNYSGSRFLKVDPALSYSLFSSVDNNFMTQIDLLSIRALYTTSILKNNSTHHVLRWAHIWCNIYILRGWGQRSVCVLRLLFTEVKRLLKRARIAFIKKYSRVKSNSVLVNC